MIRISHRIFFLLNQGGWEVRAMLLAWGGEERCSPPFVLVGTPTWKT